MESFRGARKQKMVWHPIARAALLIKPGSGEESRACEVRISDWNNEGFKH